MLLNKMCFYSEILHPNTVILEHVYVVLEDAYAVLEQGLLLTGRTANWDMILFRKSRLLGSFKPRHVTNQDVFVLATVQYLLISTSSFSF